MGLEPNGWWVGLHSALLNQWGGATLSIGVSRPTCRSWPRVVYLTSASRPTAPGAPSPEPSSPVSCRWRDRDG